MSFLSDSSGCARFGSQPLIVAGMHRSGTSLAASFLAGLGVDIGRRLLPGDRNNRHGYFEDEEFLELQRRMVAACCPPESEGWPDWGFTIDGQFLEKGVVPFRDAAADLAHSGARHGVWGWKDPRTTLLLDFWRELLPHARFVGVFRAPWEVADSIRRVNAGPFRSRPERAFAAWALYNSRLLSFVRRHREHILLVEAAAIPEDPVGVVLAARERLGIDLPTGEMEGGDVAATARVVAARIHDPEILIRRSASSDPLPEGVGALWDELLATADVRVERSAIRHVRGLKPRDPGPSPAVSVVIPCHDDGRFLGDAIASALLSETPVPEIVIVDDGSSDPDTIAALGFLKEAGFLVVRQENRGLGAARNAGIHVSRGRYILPLDADNLLRPAYIPAALAVLEAQPRVGVVYGDALYFGSRRGRWSVGPFDPARLAAGNFIDACAVFRREVWEETGGYDEEMGLLGHQDWDLWLGAAERDWELLWVERPLFDYRVRSGSMTSRLFGEDVRRALWMHVVTKHRALFEAHLPDILARCDLALHAAAVRIEELSLPVPRVAQSSAARLPDDAFRLQWIASELPVAAGTGEILHVSVTVRNTGTIAWPDLASAGVDGWYAVRLGFRWWREDRVLGEEGRGDLSSPLPPGETATIGAGTTAPMTPGRYRLQVDMLQETVAWFEMKGAPRLETAVLVTERSRS